MGVVFGDIGTSPLYALRECFHESHGLTVTTDNVLGILSLIVWSLVLVVTIKYLLFVMKADNDGEGGMLALMALSQRSHPVSLRKGLSLVATFGLIGVAFLYSDGIITPAISVLSAVEGLTLATDLFNPYILPITVAFVALLFTIQRRGSGRIGSIFGPIMLVWFATMALLGLYSLIQTPDVLLAANPLYGIRFLIHHAGIGFLVLGSVFLVLTGAEALYADMGHFGRGPIQLGWFAVALPALLLQYFGQGALLMRDPAALANPFYHLAPAWMLYPLIALATIATVIASQAMLSGAFSLTLQAVQLGYLPPLRITHTSAEQHGQIYFGVLNWLMFVGTVGSDPFIRLLQQPRRGLWHRCLRLHDHHDAAHVPRSPHLLAMESAAGSSGGRGILTHRPRLFSRECSKDSAWWMVPAAPWRSHFHRHEHLGARSGYRGRSSSGAISSPTPIRP